MKACVHTETRTHMFTVAFFTTTQWAHTRGSIRTAGLSSGTGRKEGRKEGGTHSCHNVDGLQNRYAGCEKPDGKGLRLHTSIHLNLAEPA